MAQDLSYLLSEQTRLQASIASLNAQLEYARTNGNPQIVAGLEARIASAQELLDVVQSQIQESQTQVQASTQPVNSAGQIASDEGASIQNPITPPGRVTVEGITDEQLRALQGGTDNTTTRTVEQTQSTPGINLNSSGTTGTNFGTGVGLNPTPFQSAGVGAPRDDNTAPTTNSTQQIVNSSFNQPIKPQPNVLDQFPSYTYSLSWYLLTPLQLKSMQETGFKNPASWQLLMQSGGASTAQAGPATADGLATSGRNQYFSQDYYMDNLEIDSLVPLKGTGMAHTATAISFDVAEPNGLTLIKNLYNAVVTTYKNANVAKDSINYLMAQYCLVIRFYGYDEQGNLVTKLGRRGTNGNVNLTDPTAVIEKFYPFIIDNLNFRLNSGQVIYHVKAKPIAQFYNISQDRGTIPSAYNLVGTTIGDVLNGKVQATNVAAQNNTRPGAPTTNTSPGAPELPPGTTDDPQTQQLFNDGTGYDPGYDPNAGWSA